MQITYSPGKAVNVFTPFISAGAAIDGHPQGDLDRILTKENIHAMLAVGLGPVSYRLRTELSIEAWHWNPNGSWSDPKKQQGYWTSSDQPTGDIQISNGYRLPRRGNTHDQADDDDYSRLDDGDTTSFWKSDPYLDNYYTHESNSLHPQWVIVDLGKSRSVNAIRIHWGDPYAISYKLDYATDIGPVYFDPLQPGLWHNLPNQNTINYQKKDILITIASKPISLRFIRITMTESSGTSATNSTDIRDRLGFAIKEMQAGLIDDKGKFHDYIHHAANNHSQSIMHTSSTDPWHRAVDIDTNAEQSGIDRFFTCGLTNDLSVLMPMAVLYDTPDNMAALVKYIKAKKYKVNELEMGEEPEGQLIDPEDYAVLYDEWADAIKKIDPSMKLGGPGFASLATTTEDQYSFTEQTWTRQFLAFLSSHHHLSDFNFFSFEWYPFDDVCAPTAPQLAANPQMMMNALKKLKEDILPPGTPLYITEYGYSAHSGRAQVDIEGALMYADILGNFLTLGGSKAFLYGYEPTYLDQYNHCSWGNNMLFGMDENGKIIYHTAAYYGVCMMIKDWLRPADSLLQVYPAVCDIVNKQKQDLVSAFAVCRPGNKWSIMLINKDPKKTWKVNVSIQNSSLHFPLRCVQYSRSQYHWVSKGMEGYPSLELPSTEKTIPEKGLISLPPYSLTIVRDE